MNNNFLVSFNICCFNSEKYIAETIDSIIHQTYKNWEIIIIDDGSTDKTEIIIKKYISRGVNIKYFFQNNRGFAYSRNIAISKSNGDWIAIIDHDDICLKNRIEYQILDILKNPNCKFFFSNIEVFNNKINYDWFKNFLKKDKFNVATLDLKKGKAKDNLINYGCFINSSSIIFNKEIINNNIKFDNKYKFIADYVFFINIAEKYDLHCTNIILTKWRMHDDQSTSKKEKILLRELSSLYFNFYLISLSFKNKRNILYKHIKIFIKLFLLYFKND